MINKCKHDFLTLFALTITLLASCGDADRVLFPGNNFYYTVSDGDKTFLIDGMIGSGVKEYDCNTGKSKDFLVKMGGKEIALTSVNDFVVGDEDYWVNVGFREGIYKINKTNRDVTVINKKDGLVDDKVMALAYIDHNLFIGYTDYGLSIYNPVTGKFTNCEYKFQNTKSRYEDYISIFEIGKLDNKILIGTQQLGLLVFENGEFKPFYQDWKTDFTKHYGVSVQVIYSDNEILSFCSNYVRNSRRSYLYIGYKEHKFKYDEINIEEILAEGNENICSIQRMGSKLVLAFEYCLAIYDIQKKIFVKTIKLEQLCPECLRKYKIDYIYGLGIDKKNVWIAAPNGMIRLDKATFENEWLTDK